MKGHVAVGRIASVLGGLAVILVCGAAAAQTEPPKSIQTFSLAQDGDTGTASVAELLKDQEAGRATTGGKPLDVRGISARAGAMSDDKLEASIATLNDLIEETDDDDPSKPEYLARLGEVYWDKAENFLNKAQGNEMNARLRKATEAQDEAAIQAIEAEQKDLMEQREFWQLESVSAYRRVVDYYPEYPAIDETLYYLGFALVQMGRQAEAFPYFARLVREAPNSQYVPEALLNIGEFYFNAGRMEDAEKMYTEVENFKDSTIYGLAIYKKGWCLYNLARHEEAMNQFLTVIDFAKTPEAVKSGYARQLLKESQKDLVMVYSQVGSPDSAIKVFKAISPDGYMDLAIKLAEGYASQGDFEKSSRLYKNIIAEYATRDDAWRIVQFQTAIFGNAYNSGIKKDVVEEASRLIGLLDKYRAIAPKDFIDAEMMKAEELIRVVATTYHNEARKTKETATLEFTHELYNEYLRLFPDAKYVYEITVNYAYLLQDIGQDELAAERFTQIVKMRPEGPQAAEAAHAAVMAYYNLGEDQENKAKSDDTSDTEKKELSTFDQKLVAACETYLAMATKDSPDVVQAQFVKSMAYYRANHFEQASGGFRYIIDNFPEHENAPGAARLLLSSLVLMRDIPGLNDAADAIASRPQLMKDDVPGIIHRINEQKDFNACFEFEQKGLNSRAAECFMAYILKFPATPLKDRALINAGNNFFKARRVEDSLKANGQLVNEFPDSDLAARAVFNIADTYRRLAVYSEAARFYERFVELYPKHELVEEALRFATMLRTGLGDHELAIRDLRRYLKMFPKSEHAAGVALEIPGILVKQGKPVPALKEYNDYLAKYGQAGGVDRRLLVYLRIANTYKTMSGVKNAIAAREGYDKVIAVYDALTEDEKRLVSSIGLAAVAEAMMVKGEAVLDAMRAIKLSGSIAVVSGQIAKKLELSEQAMTIFNTIEKFGQPNWTIAAYSRRGFGFQELAQSIENTPAPKNLNLEQRQLFREGMSEKAMPVWEKAKESFRRCVRGAQELKWYNKYSEEAEDALMDIDPDFRSLPDMRPKPDYYSVLTGRMTLLAERDGQDIPKWSDPNLETRVRNAATAPDTTPEALYNMGAWLKSMGRKAEARTWFDRVLAVKPGFDKAQAAVGMLLFEEGNVADAEAWFARAVAIDPANAIANAYYGWQAIQRRDFPEAINVARIGLISDPDSRDAYAVLAAAYIGMGQIDAGLLVAQNALSLDPADGQIENLKGLMFLRQGEVRQAVKMFEKASIDSPMLYDAWMNLGLVTLGYKDFNSSGTAFQKALELKPTSRDARISLAIVERGSDRGAEALKILTGLASQADDPEAHFNLCLLYQENLADADKALDECTTFMSMTPATHPRRREVEKRIEGIKMTIEALEDSGDTGITPEEPVEGSADPIVAAPVE